MFVTLEPFWKTVLEKALSIAVGAEGWSLTLTDRHRQIAIHLGDKGDVAQCYPEFEAVLDGMVSRGRLERTSVEWLDCLDAPQKRARGEEVSSLMTFVHPVETGWVLTGGLVLHRAGLEASCFGGVDNLLDFLGTQAACAARWRSLEEEHRAIGKLMSALALQCVVVDRSGRVVYESRQGQQPASLRSVSARQDTGTRGAIVRTMIDQAVTEYRDAPRSRTRPYHVVAVGRNTREVVPLYIVPLTQGMSDQEEPEFLALLVPSPTEPIRREALVQAFSLTPAEANVVRRIISGKKVKDIALETDLTEQTVRTYLKHSYEKLGVSSQSELIAKIVGLSIPLGARPQRIAS